MAAFGQVVAGPPDGARRGEITLEDPEDYLVDGAPTPAATAADIPAEAAPVANVGMALLTNRGLRTAASRSRGSLASNFFY